MIADSRSPRDGRFIERIGYFNPLLPKEKTERLRLDLDKVKAWLAKGALPTDHVLRFLDDRVANVTWLTSDEKRLVIDNISREEGEKEGFSELSHAFGSGQVWLLGQK